MGLFDGAADLAGDLVGGAADVAGDAVDWTGNALGDAFGTNKHKSDVYQVNSGSYENPQAGENRQELRDTRAGALNRTAPQADIAQRTQVATAGATKVGPASTVNGVTLGPAAQATGATIDRGEDQQMRAMQLELAKRLEAQSQGLAGPTLAELQLRKATDRNVNLAQAQAASAGGNAAVAQRMATRQAAEANRDAAMGSAELRMAEQMEAQKQLAGLASQTRQQDTDVASKQADLRQRTEELNIDTLNRFELAQKQMGFDAQKFNALQQQEMSKMQASIDQETGFFNAKAYNEMYGANLSAETQTRIANLNAKLQQGQLNDEMYRDLLGKELALNESERQANIQYEEDRLKGSMGQEQLDAQSAEAVNARAGAITGGVLGGVAGGIAALKSDPAAKQGTQDLTTGQPTSTWGTGTGYTEPPKTTAFMQAPAPPKDAEWDLDEKRFMSPEEAQEKRSDAAKKEQLDKADKERKAMADIAKAIGEKFTKQLESVGQAHEIKLSDVGGGGGRARSFRDNEALFTSDPKSKDETEDLTRKRTLELAKLLAARKGGR